MKKNHIVASIICVCIFNALINTSCKKEEPAKVIEQFTIKVNNTPVSTKKISTNILKGSANKKYLQITATLTNDNLAYVNVYYNEIPGNAIVNVAKEDKGNFSYLVHSTGILYDASVDRYGSSGRISIFKNNLNARTIEGTFSGLAVRVNNIFGDKINLSGSFAVSY